MIEFVWKGSFRSRLLAGIGILLILVQWWWIPALSEEFREKWLWSLSASSYFPFWFRLLFPLLLVCAPIQSWLGAVVGWFSRDPSKLFKLLLITLASGTLFWLLRVTVLELGDSHMIMDNFISLTTYASIREPLESVTHTDLARFLYRHWGIHPQASFQLLSCFWGVMVFLVAGWGLASWSREGESHLWALPLVFLIGPVHLFFGYIEWYTQLVSGLILFLVYGTRRILTGRGFWIAFLGWIFASCSHLVGFGFFPAVLVLMFVTAPQAKRGRWLIFALTLTVLFIGITFAWIDRHINLRYSTAATAKLFATLMPLMSADNPDNPPGAWQYPWLSMNHLVDLVNELILCSYFSIMILMGVLPGWQIWKTIRTAFSVSLVRNQQGSERKTSQLVLFFIPQLVLGGLFLLLWNPWLGFPTDWDLFSFYAWPLLAVALLVYFAWGTPETARTLLWIAGIPSFSVVMAWILFYHRAELPSSREVQAYIDGTRADYFSEQAQQAIAEKKWPEAFSYAEDLMRADRKRIPEALEMFKDRTLQVMADEWPDPDQITRMAVDFEIVSASPVPRLGVLDCWGRVFLSEAGFLNAWSLEGIPGIPEHHAVAMEIVPWKQAAVILREDGALFEIPIPSWVDPHPGERRKTFILDPPLDRSPRPMGNLITEYARAERHPGSCAVDLAVDHQGQHLVALESSGKIFADSPHVDYKVDKPVPFLGCSLKLYWDGSQAYVLDVFGGLKGWPGGTFHIDLGGFGFPWHAVADMDFGRGGSDLYILDAQGGVHNFSNLGRTVIDPKKMNHYSPHGLLEKEIRYQRKPVSTFHRIKMVPNDISFYRMTWNFGIYYSDLALDRVEPFE